MVILCFLDDHSRYALSVTCHPQVTGPGVVAGERRRRAGPRIGDSTDAGGNFANLASSLRSDTPRVNH
jgi:hypothetical protein